MNMFYMSKICRLLFGIATASGCIFILMAMDLQKYIHTSTKQVYSWLPNTEQTRRNLIASSSNENEMTIKSIYQKRKDIIRNVCNKNDELFLGTTSDIQVKTNLHLDRNHNIFYCQIQKVGSTFMRSLLAKVHSKSNITKTKPPLTRLSTIQNFRFAELYSGIRKSFRFLFVREPYGRALSGYIDKLFAPNPLYWGSVGKFAVKQFRTNASATSLQCGHDLTFPEFVKYLIYSQDTGKNRDRHFYPMYEHCLPCEIDYDFVGKLETFKNDTLFLIDHWNKKFGTSITFGDFEKESDIEFARSQIGRLYSFRANVEKCMTFHQGMKRVWRLLQARGVISIKDELPVSSDKASTMEKKAALEMVNKAINGIGIQDRESLKSQRFQVVVDAYRLVPMEDLQILGDILRPDCELFDYDPLPSYLFNRESDDSLDKSGNDFSFFDAL